MAAHSAGRRRVAVVAHQRPDGRRPEGGREGRKEGRREGGLKLIIELEKTAAVDSLLRSSPTRSTAMSVRDSVAVASLPPHGTKLHDERRRRRKKKKPTNEARRDGRTTCK